MFDKYKKEIDFYLQEFLNNKVDEAKNKDKVYQELVGQIKDLTMRAGKRIRPLLVLYGYKLFKKEEPDGNLIKFSLCIELFQTACLIHDDIMDCAKTRRDGKSINESMGDNMAILAGDLALVWADEFFNREEVREYFNLLREEVIYGQALDLSKNKYTLEVYKYKTAKYTFERPLHIGAVLGGANQEGLKMLSAYAIPVGIAFQIQDDILDNEAQDGDGNKAKKLAMQGKKAILEYNGSLDPESKDFLARLSDFVVSRKA